MREKNLKLKKILKGKKVQKFKEFLDYYKQFVGLADWDIIVGIGNCDDNILATVDAELLEKILYIGICKDFFKFKPSKQKNILWHELVHGRILLFRKRYEVYKGTEEEYMINDLVRGAERLGVLKFKGEKKWGGEKLIYQNIKQTA